MLNTMPQLAAAVVFAANSRSGLGLLRDGDAVTHNNDTPGPPRARSDALKDAATSIRKSRCPRAGESGDSRLGCLQPVPGASRSSPF